MTAATTRQQTVLRELTWRDIPAVAALEPVLFPDDAWSEASWWAELAGRPRRRYVLATDGDGVLGYAGLDAPGEVADVMTIAVAPSAQGAGLGRRLMDWLVSQAKESGAAYLMLEVREDNRPALALYERSGFEVVRVRQRYYQPGDVDALVMRRPLR